MKLAFCLPNLKKMRSVFAVGLGSSLFLAIPAMADEGKLEASAEQAQPSAGQQQEPQVANGATTADKYKRAGEILHQMLPANVATSMASGKPRNAFGGEMSRLAFENSYVQLWTRPGLSLKERSLVTISMLIALGNEKELAVHLASGLRNGLTPDQLEEVIYHSTAYAGFPRAADALAIATEVVAQEHDN